MVGLQKMTVGLFLLLSQTLLSQELQMTKMMSSSTQLLTKQAPRLNSWGAQEIPALSRVSSPASLFAFLIGFQGETC